MRNQRFQGGEARRGRDGNQSQGCRARSSEDARGRAKQFSSGNPTLSSELVPHAPCARAEALRRVQEFLSLLTIEWHTAPSVELAHGGKHHENTKLALERFAVDGSRRRTGHGRGNASHGLGTDS